MIVYSIRPKYVINHEKYCGVFKKMLYAIKRNGTNKIDRKTAAQISNEKKVIKGLTQKDAHKIGYVAGAEHIVVGDG